MSCERFPVVVVDHEQVGKEDDGPGEEDEGEENSHNLERGESKSGFKEKFREEKVKKKNYPFHFLCSKCHLEVPQDLTNTF